MALYYDDFSMNNANPPTTASILAIGDSWFWYPFPGGSLLNNIDLLTRQKQHTILAKGNNGAEVFDYVHGVYERQVSTALKLYGWGLSAVLISGGGNDFAGFNDLRPLLKDNCAGAASASDCFKVGTDGLSQFLRDVDANFRTLIGRIYTHTNLNCMVFMHTYDYAIPDGRPVFRNGKAWLKPALDDAQVPAALQQACVIYLMDRFYATLKSICALDPQHLFVVDSRGTLGPSDWANELHPKSFGFGKIVKQRWEPMLVANNLA